MGTKSPGGPQRCRLILKQCIAVQLSKPGHTLDDFWMYDSGYMVFQNFLSANAQCWWNAPLTAATRALKYAGHVAPGMLLVSGEPCALEVVRGAYARSVLKPPATYVISSVDGGQPRRKLKIVRWCPIQFPDFTPPRVATPPPQPCPAIRTNTCANPINDGPTFPRKFNFIREWKSPDGACGGPPRVAAPPARVAIVPPQPPCPIVQADELTDDDPRSPDGYNFIEEFIVKDGVLIQTRFAGKLSEVQGLPPRVVAPPPRVPTPPPRVPTPPPRIPTPPPRVPTPPPQPCPILEEEEEELSDDDPRSPDGYNFIEKFIEKDGVLIQTRFAGKLSEVQGLPPRVVAPLPRVPTPPPRIPTPPPQPCIILEEKEELSDDHRTSSRKYNFIEEFTLKDGVWVQTKFAGKLPQANEPPLRVAAPPPQPCPIVEAAKVPDGGRSCRRKRKTLRWCPIQFPNFTPPQVATSPPRGATSPPRGATSPPRGATAPPQPCPTVRTNTCPNPIGDGPTFARKFNFIREWKSPDGACGGPPRIPTPPPQPCPIVEAAALPDNGPIPRKYNFILEEGGLVQPRFAPKPPQVAKSPPRVPTPPPQPCPIVEAAEVPGDIDDCIVTPIMQGQFTPLPEALCDVIMDLTAEGHSATIKNIRSRIEVRFPHMTPPSIEVIYDSLAQLMQEQKIYQTAKGYFILTPERRRSRSRPRNHQNGYNDGDDSTDTVPQEPRTILMTNAEALHSLYGEISTERDGDLTHQCIQTNLADVICGGNSHDKIMYPRTSKRRSSSFPTPRSLERRHSLRIFGSSKRLQRCASTRSLSKTYANTLNTDSSSSEYQSTDSSSPKKGSLLSRLFRRSGRNKVRQLETYSGQFPPAEWFNSKAVHLHSVGTQTQDLDMPAIHTLSNSTFYDGSELSQRSLTLPRRHRRNLSSESTFLISSRDCSPIRRRSPAYFNSSLPRSTQSIPASANANSSNVAATTKGTSSARTSTPYTSSQSRHMLEHSPTRSTNFSHRSANATRSCQDTKNDYRLWQSGPSSIESGKTSLYPSGPSSIESGKVPYNRTSASGHSSLESQRSTSSTVVQQQPRSIIMLNGSPRGTPRHQILRARNAEQIMRNQSSSTTNNSSTSFSLPPPPPPTTNESKSTNSRDTSNPDKAKRTPAITNSTSNNSITLKLTTSNDGQHNLPNTKIVVQNTPEHSVITFENSKLTENSNVFIINNETTTNERGEVVRKTLSKQNMPSLQRSAEHGHLNSKDQSPETIISEQKSLENNSRRGTDADTLSYMNTISADSGNNEGNELPKLPKNFGNDNSATMNNIRNWSSPIIPANTDTIIYKNNVLKNSEPPIQSAGKKKDPSWTEMSKPNAEISGSVGNLRFYDRKSKDALTKTINSNCELNNPRYESTSRLTKNDNLNSNASLNGGSLVQMLQKNSITIGSEPNLAQKDTNCTTTIDKSICKDSLDRRLSLSKERAETETMFNFPSLTDLSFNFTSLAAQKILQGVNLNSIDTIVAAAAVAAASNATNASALEKQQNINQSANVCTDLGLI